MTKEQLEEVNHLEAKKNILFSIVKMIDDTDARVLILSNGVKQIELPNSIFKEVKHEIFDVFLKLAREADDQVSNYFMNKMSELLENDPKLKELVLKHFSTTNKNTNDGEGSKDEQKPTTSEPKSEENGE